jgi:SAM-dependent methyltransferase
MSRSTDWMRPSGTGRVLPPEVDLTRPSVARMYDYLLGGKDNFAVDRAACEGFLRALPESRQVALDNRSVLRRAVRYLVAEAGIKQIIDIGSGLPTVGNVHEVAQAVDPGVRVVYVDKDPIVLAHARALLVDNDNTAVITADLVQEESIFEHPTTKSYINIDEPFAILASAILHHLTDEQDPAGITARLRRRLPAGGYLLVTNFFDNGDPRARILERALQDIGVTPGRFRTYREQIRYFDGLEMVEPGLVRANEWRPDRDTLLDSPVHDLYAAGLGRKR